MFNTILRPFIRTVVVPRDVHASHTNFSRFHRSFFTKRRMHIDAFFVFTATRSFSITGFATSITPYSTASDPAEVQANQCLDRGTQKLEEGDIEAAKVLYKRSVEINKTASSLFNLGVTHYHLSECDYMPILAFNRLYRGV